MRRAFAAAAFLVALFASPGTDLRSQPRYTPCEVVNAGIITGKVSLKGALPAIDRMEVSQDHKVCGKTKPSPRLVIGKEGGVADAIVYLEGVTRGKKFPAGDACLLEQHNCEYNPHTLVVPLGNCLQIVNSDQLLHNVHAYETTGDCRTVFNIAQPIKGVKSRTRAFTQPGMIRVSCDAGHPWMSANVMVAENPYYALTDNNGNFSISDVPPGEYTLRLWHEGITIVDKLMEHGKVKSYEFEKPYEESMKVTVSSKTTSTANFELTMR